MRLRRLDLIRYGQFTDSSLEFPDEKCDFHLLFGQNEAGKSTALAAIEDMLFGIPVQSQYNFLHDYSSMRIGTVLENCGKSLEVVRRKGDKDTLLGSDGLPVTDGESALMFYLTGVDRSFFQRMFSLDHSRLREGGKEILEAKDDVGQMLFSAGSGIVGFRQRLSQLSDQADSLWATRRSKHRKYYIAEDKFKEAQAALREHTLTTKKWRELKRVYDEAEEVYTRIDNKHKETSAQRNRLSRIRRVYPDLRQKLDLDRQLKELENVIVLPDKSAILLATAKKKEDETVTRITTLQERLDRAKEISEEVSFDETLVQRADDVRQLHERRIEIRSEKADLPKRQAELNAAEEDLQADARELEWTETDPAALMMRIPSRAKIGQARSLLNRRGELEAEIRNHTRVLQESRKTRDELKQQLNRMRQPVDVSRLALVIRTLREQGNLEAQVRAIDKTFKATEEKVERRLKVLNPGGIDQNTLANTALPAQATVQDYLDKSRDWERRSRETHQESSLVKQELDKATATLKQIVQDEQVITSQELKEERGRRNTLWNLVKVKLVLNESITEEQYSGFEKELNNLTGTFESAMVNADDLADRRFDSAEAVGRISENKRKIGDLEINYRQMLANQAKLEDESIQLKSEWKNLWSATPFEPLSAEAMPEWFSKREKVLGAIDEQKSALHELKTLRDEVRQAKERLFNELAVFDVDVTSMESESLNVIIERADEEVRFRKDEADKNTKLKEDLENADIDVMRKEQNLLLAEENRGEWQIKWSSTLSEHGLAKDTAPEVVNSQIDVIDRMRETADRIRTLRYHRIDKINRDITDFEQVVMELVEDVAVDLADQSAENAVLELENRIDSAKRVQELQESKKNEITELANQIDKLNREWRESSNSITHLMSAAGVETKEALKKAIEQSDRKRSLNQELKSIIDKLNRDGDGKSLKELEEECENADIDDVTAHDKLIQTELDDLQNQQTIAVEERSLARDAFQAIGGDDVAARNAASKQEAITEIQEVAEKFVKVKTSVRLLQWAIDRYRREKQAPLLSRAGELFKAVTDGSFSSLRVEFDDKDVAHLTGVRPSGNIVPMSGLTTGTADQLYLSLRIAAIEDYLDRSDALPFIADDLFINFDDERAAAGFQLLGELSRKTQILFFTHHKHLVNVAQETLGTSVNLVTLSNCRRVNT